MAVTAALSPSNLPQSSTGRFDVLWEGGFFCPLLFSHSQNSETVRRWLGHRLG